MPKIPSSCLSHLIPEFGTYENKNSRRKHERIFISNLTIGKRKENENLY